MKMRYRINNQQQKISFSLDMEKYQIYFPEREKKLLKSRSNFVISGPNLLTLKHNLTQSIIELLQQLPQSKSPFPQNMVEAEVLGKTLKLDLRNELEEKIFWMNGLLNSVSFQEEIEFKYSPI